MKSLFYIAFGGGLPSLGASLNPHRLSGGLPSGRFPPWGLPIPGQGHSDHQPLPSWPCLLLAGLVGWLGWLGLA